MSSPGSPSSPTVPLKFRRKSSSASTSVSLDDHMYGLGDAAPSSSSPPSSSPVPTPVHLARYGPSEWPAGDYPDDLDDAVYARRDGIEHADYPWSCHARPEHSFPNTHRPLPSLMAKFAASALRSSTPLSYDPSPSHFSSQATAYLYPQGDSAVADECEEYDLESMDIHIRETYFATSAERGRWLSSPIMTRVRSQAILPGRGHSSPIKTMANTPPREHLHRHKRRHSVDKQISALLSKDCDEDVRCSSPLPPSSPLSSPISSLSFLGDDRRDGSVGDPPLNSDDCHSPFGTPELSISPTTCTSSIEFTGTPIPHETLVTSPALLPTSSPLHSLGSVISRHTSPVPSHSPGTVDARTQSSSANSLELECILPSLLQTDSGPGLMEAGSSKLPLSDTVNKPYPGLHIVIPGVTQRQDVPSCVQSLLISSDHAPLSVSLDTIGGTISSRNKRGKKKESATGDPGERGSRRRTTARSRSSAPKQRKGVSESHALKCLEPPSKKSKRSHCGDDSASCEGKSRVEHNRKPKVERLSPHPFPAVEGHNPEPTRSRNKKSSKSVGPTPVMNAVDAELDASLTGMVVEALATSRATSMDSGALYVVLTQAHPHLAAERSKEELMMDIARALEGGRARCGMFEKVDSSGEGTRHKVLESRWFYVPERDEDSERASLISAIMPRQKRNETKKYKQYYYRPLDKICRWDPEDEP